MNKDREVDEILQSFVKIDDCQINNYIDSLKDKMNRILLVNEENQFNLRKDEIKDMILDFSTSLSCIKYKLECSAKENGLNVDFDGTAIGLKIDLPERHDFCVCLARAFSWDTFCSFFIPWIKEASVFIESNGTCYPRFMRAVQMNGQIPHFCTYILITEFDIGDGYNDMKRNLSLPRYYPFYKDKIATLDIYEALYKKYLYSWEENFEKFKKGEYVLYSYIKNNQNKFKQEPVCLV